MWPVVAMRLVSRLSSRPKVNRISDHFTPNWMRQDSPAIYPFCHKLGDDPTKCRDLRSFYSVPSSTSPRTPNRAHATRHFSGPALAVPPHVFLIDLARRRESPA